MRYILIIGLLFSACACLRADRQGPEEQIDAFFDTLNREGPQLAIDYLTEGTLLKERMGVHLKSIISNFEAALKILGSVERIERVDEKKLGESLVIYRLITYHESASPLFWQFIFFRPKAEWQVYTFVFNDELEVVFKDT